MLLARLLGREAFGLLGMTMVVTGLAGVMVEAGLGSALIQRREVSAPLLATVFWTGLAAGLVQWGLIWTGAPIIAAALHQPAIVGLLRGCGAALVLGPLGLVHRCLLARELGFPALARIELLAAVGGAAAALTLAVWGAGAGALAARVVVTAGATAALAWAAHPWRPTAAVGRASRWDGRGLRSLLPFSAGITGTELLNQAAQNVDFLLVGRWLGAGVLGEYALAYSLATLPQGRLAPVLARVMFPVFSRVQDDPGALRRGYRGLVQVVALISFPLLTALALLGALLLPTLYGAEWRGAAAVLPALCVAGAFYAVATTVGSLYRATGRPGLELGTTALRAALLTGCVGAGLAGSGTARGVAVAVAIYAGLSTLAFQPVANRLIGMRMREYLAALAPGVAVSLLVALALRLMM